MVGLLGDMGGIQGILISLLGVLVMPISAHSFTMKAARKFFMARSSDKNLFRKYSVAKMKNKLSFDEDMIKSQSLEMQ